MDTIHVLVVSLLFHQLSFILTPINAPRDNNWFDKNKRNKAILIAEIRIWTKELRTSCHFSFVCNPATFGISSRQSMRSLCEWRKRERAKKRALGREEKKMCTYIRPHCIQCFLYRDRWTKLKAIICPANTHTLSISHTHGHTKNDSTAFSFLFVNIINEKRNDLTRQRLTCSVCRHILPSNHI